MESKDTPERQSKEVCKEDVQGKQPAKDKPADGRRRYTARAKTVPVCEGAQRITSPGIVVTSGGILDFGSEWESTEHLPGCS